MGFRQRTLSDGSTITDIDLLEDNGDIDRLKKAEAEKKPRPLWLTRAYGKTLLHDFRNDYRTLDGFDLIERFTQVLSARYHQDSLTPGIHIACLSAQPGDKPLYYAATHRYPKGNKHQRQVVVSAKGGDAKQAMKNMLDTWFELLEAERAEGVEELDTATLRGSPFGKEPVDLPRGQPPRTPVQGSLADMLQKSLDALKGK